METYSYIYIQKDLPGYFEVQEQLNADFKTGETWEDYLSGAWIPLSDEQVAFRQANPNASGKEVFDMQLIPVPERTLEHAKSEKIAAIDMYDNSDAVNSFTFNGANCWFTASDRSTYKTSIDAAELLGEENIRLPMAGEIITLPVRDAKMMLALLQRYADNAAIMTATHKAIVSQLTDIAAVDAYDYTTGYPDRLPF